MRDKRGGAYDELKGHGQLAEREEEAMVLKM